MKKENLILVVDDDVQEVLFLKTQLLSFGEVEVAHSVKEAQQKIQKQKYTFILLDFHLNDQTAVDFMRWFEKSQQQSVIVVMSAFSSITKAVEVIRLGAVDFLEKPITASKLQEIFLTYLDSSSQDKKSLPTNVIYHPQSAFAFVMRLIEVVSNKNCPVFLTGESGTGKEILAKQIHFLSSRAQKKFVALNCGALPENLIEAELFGYQKGAFTGGG